MTLVFLSLALVIGVYLGSHLALPLEAALPCAAAAVAVAVLWRRSRRVLLGGLCIALILCGAIRFGAVPDTDDLKPHIGEEVTISGVVVDDPDPSGSSVGLTIEASTVNGVEASGIFILRTTRYPSYEYGDLLTVSGELEEPANFGDFDYRGYLERQGIYTTMYYPQVERLASGQGPLQPIYSLRQRMGESLAASLPEPQAALAQGMLLGLRDGIPQTLYDDFRQSGTAHLLAISGLHMAIVAGILLSLSLSLFGRRRPTYFIITLAVLWLYALLAGMSPSVMRAAIMVSVFLFGAHLGRQRSGGAAVAFAAAMMVAIDPRILWQVSFQLSFAAVLGLITLAPALQRWGRGVGLPALVADSLAYSLGATIATLPLVAYYFGYVSLVGLPATFLATLALPAVIVLSAVVGFIGLFAPPLAQVVGWVDWLFLKYMTLVVQGLASLPWSWRPLAIEAYLVWLYYGVLGAGIWIGSRLKRLSSKVEEWGLHGDMRPRKPWPGFLKWVVAPLSIVAILIWVAAAAVPDDGVLEVALLDVGQGDAILVTTPSGQRILVDGGPDPELVCLELGEALPFWEREIDLVVLTHAHTDHVCGLVEVLRRYEVGQVLYPALYPIAETAAGGLAGEELPAYEEFCALVVERGIAHTAAAAGQRIDPGDGATLEVLNPTSEFFEGTESDMDNNGVVLRVSMGEVSFLLSADIQWEGELLLVCEGVGLSSTVLKVGHHGSSTSTSPVFLDTVGPQAAAISVGADNRFGHPTAEVMARLDEAVGASNVYTTAERGAITFTTDGERLWLRTER